MAISESVLYLSLFQSESCGIAFHMKMSFSHVHSLIFIRKVMHLASFLTGFFHRGAVAQLVRAPVL